MSLADLSSALGALPNNPLFQLGTGIMAASGPSPVPVGFGQALGGGMTYANQMAMKQAQAQMMRAQFARFAFQNKILSDFYKKYGGSQSSGTANPNFDAALSGTASQRAQSALNPNTQQQLYGSQGFTPGISATPTQIASQQFPLLSQSGAQATGLAPTAGPTDAPSSSAPNDIVGNILHTPAGMASFAFNPEGTMNFALSRQFGAPTPVQTLIQEQKQYPQGSQEWNALQAAINKAGSVQVRQGGANIGPNGVYYLPRTSLNTTFNNPNDPSQGVHAVPGATAAELQTQTATSLGDKLTGLTNVTNSSGAQVPTPNVSLYGPALNRLLGIAGITPQAPGAPQGSIGAAGAQSQRIGGAIAQPSGFDANLYRNPVAWQDSRFYSDIPKGYQPAPGIGQSTQDKVMLQEQGKQWATLQTQAQEDAQTANDALVRHQKMLDLLQSGQVHFGPVSNQITELKNVAKEFGVNLGDPAPNQEFGKYAYQAATSVMKKIYGGRITESEVKQQIQNNPGTTLAEKANYALLKLQIHQDRIDMAKPQILQGYLQHGGSPFAFNSWFASKIPNPAGIKGPTPQTAQNFANYERTQTIDGQTYGLKGGSWYAVGGQ